MSGSVDRFQFLLRLQEELGGAIPFDRWMKEALYHPQFGYYTANIRTVGRTGDFSTWATLHESLGRAIAGWIKNNLFPAKLRHVIELGAGTGALAATVLRNLPWWNRPRYHIVEVSPILRLQQEKLLRGKRISWHDSMADALAATDGAALIFSNELVDAFPCRIFQKQEDSWRELALRLDEKSIGETWQDRPLPASTLFDHPWPEGQRVEIHESFHEWLQDWLPHWRKGKMLTVDYGDRAPALYHRRPQGSLRAYAHHQCLEGKEAYAGFGLRDLTADVNFSDLAQWGEGLGLRTESLQTLREFLLEKEQPTAAALFVAGGAAESFRGLIQAR